MTNSESIALVTEAIKSSNAAISVYDSLNERIPAARATVDIFSADLAALRINTAGLDARARGTKFAATNSALTLAELDLKALEDAISVQRDRTGAIGKAAAGALFELRDQLRNHRLASLSARLSSEFDFNRLPGLDPQILAQAHQSVCGLESLGVHMLNFELQHDDDFTIKSIRRLDAHWAELKPLAESEPGLSLSISPVVVRQASKPKTVVGNQLGAMVAPEEGKLSGALTAF